MRRSFAALAVGLICLSLAAVATVARAAPVVAKKKTWQTYPMPPRVKPADPMAFAPGFAIPEQPERIVWKITAPKNEPTLTQAPVYAIGPNGRLSKIGNVPLGTALTLDLVRKAGNRHFYALKYTDAAGKQIDAWVSGNYIAAAGLAPVQ